MDGYLIRIIILLFSFVGAFIALFGDTWNKDKKRLTKLGLALLIPMIGVLSFGIWSEIQTEVRANKVKKEAAVTLLEELAPIQAYLDSMIRNPREVPKELLATIPVSLGEVEAKFNRHQHLFGADTIKAGEDLLVPLKCIVLEVERFKGTDSRLAILIDQAHMSVISFVDFLFSEIKGGASEGIEESYDNKLEDLCLAWSGEKPLGNTNTAIPEIKILITNHTLKELSLERKGAFVIFDTSAGDEPNALLSGNVIFDKKDSKADNNPIIIKSETITIRASIQNSHLANSYLNEGNLDLQIYFKFGDYIFPKNVKFTRSDLEKLMYLRLTRLHIPS